MPLVALPIGRGSFFWTCCPGFKVVNQGLQTQPKEPTEANRSGRAKKPVSKTLLFKRIYAMNGSLSE
jgi:hypothetical protein